MSDKIDRRIVEMSFENHKFEKGILESKNSLSEFNKALRNSAGGKDFSNLENSVGAVSKSFSILEQIGIGALRRIGEAAVNAGTNLIKSLSIDQLTAGWSKYEEKLEAVQTMISAGYNMDEVKEQMEQLMWFSDETSYSFSDMANNMGKFVAAGVDLKASTKAMQGIATWAAISGKKTDAASIAMFNLSQAISMGYVDTMNWRSIMNQNMNTKMFKSVVIGVGEAIGAIKKGQVTIQNFDSNLRDKWFTNEVLLKSLDQYAAYAEKVREVQEELNFDTASQAMNYMDQHAEEYGDLLSQIGNAAFKAAQESKTFADSINATMDAVSSGWLKTYEIIFGELDEAKAKFTELTDILYTVFASSAEPRNEMLAWLKHMGGIENVFKGLKQMAIALLAVLKPIAQAFDQIFPPKTKAQLLTMMYEFQKFTKSLIISGETADKVRRTFAGFFAVIDIGWQVVRFLGSVILEVAKAFVPLGGSALAASAGLGDFLVNVDKAIKSSKVFQYGLLAVKIAIVLVRNLILQLVGSVSQFITGLWHAEDPLKYLQDAAVRAFSGIRDAIKMVVNWIGEKLGTAVKKIKTVFNGGIFDESSTGFWATMLNILKEIVKFLGGKAAEGFKTFGDTLKNLDFSKIKNLVVGGILIILASQIIRLMNSITNLTSSLTGVVSAFTNKFLKTNRVVTLVKEIAFAIGALALSIWLLSKIPAEDLTKSLKGLAGAIGIFVGAYLLITGMQVAASKLMKDTESFKMAFGLIQLSASLVVMAAAIKIISTIDKTEVWNAVGVLGALLGLVAAYELLQLAIAWLIPEGKRSWDLQLSTLPLLILVGVIAILTKIKIEDVRASLGKLALMLTVIAAFELLFGVAARVSNGNKASISLLSIAVGIVAMVAVMKLLSVIKTKDITSGIANLALLVLIIAGIELVMGLAAKLGGGARVKTNILMTQISMLIMIGLVAIIRKIPDNDISRGIKTLAGMAAIIVGIELLTAAAAKLSGGAKVQQIIGSVTFAMISFVAIIAVIRTFTDEELDRGISTITHMIALIGVIELMTVVASRVGDGRGMFTTLIGVTVAIIALSGALAALSYLPQEELASATKSLAIASAAVVALSLAVRIMSEAITTMSKSSAKFGEKVKSVLLSLVSLGILLGAVVGFFWILKSVLPVVKEVEWKDLAIFVSGIYGISLLIAAFDKIPFGATGPQWVQRLKDMIPGFAAMGAIVLSAWGLFAIIGKVLPTIKNMEWGDLGKFIVGIGLIAALVLAFGALSDVMALSGAAFKEVMVGLGAALISATAVVLLAWGLTEMFGRIYRDGHEAITRGIEILVEIAEGFGKVLGAFGAGIAGGALESIAQSIKNFVTILDGVSFEGLDGLVKLALAVLIISGTEVINGFNTLLDLFTGNFTGKSPLEKFAHDIETFIKAFALISTEDAKKASDVMAALSPMIESLDALALAAKDIPNRMGLLTVLFGDNNMGPFGAQIVSFTTHMSSIGIPRASAAANTLTALVPMAEALAKFTAVATEIPNSGGELTKIFGDNQLAPFARQISQLVGIFNGDNNKMPGGGRYSAEDMTEERVTRATGVLTALTPMAEQLKYFATAANLIPPVGGIWDVVFGSQKIDLFAGQLQETIDIFADISRTDLAVATGVMTALTVEGGILSNLVKFVVFAQSLKAHMVERNVFEGHATLQEFATEFAAFLEILTTADLTIVRPAIEAMGLVTEFFETLGEDVITSALESFENNKIPYQKAIATVFDEPLASLEGRKKQLAKTLSTIFSSISISGVNTKQFNDLGKNMMNGVIEGIKSKQSAVVKAAEGVLTSTISASKKKVDSKSPSKVFAVIGAWCTKGLAVGILKEKQVAVDAGIEVASDLEEGIRDSLGVHSLSDIFKAIGEWITKSLGAGLQEGKNWLLSIAGSLGIDTANFTLDGITDTLTGGQSDLTKNISELMDSLMNSITGAAASGTGVDLGNELTDGFQQALSNSSSGLGGSESKEIVKSELQKLQDLIEGRSFYGQISVEEELELYQEIRNQYKEGSDERKQIDREIYTRLKTIYNAQTTYIEGVREAQREAAEERAQLDADYTANVAKANAEASKKLAELQTNYNNDVAKANADANKKIQDQEKQYYNQINQILNNAEKERQSTREQYADKQKSVNEKLLSDIEAQNKAYEDAVKSRADAIYNSYSLFSAVEEDEEVSGDELLQNLRDQGAALSEWKQSLTALAGRGVGDAMIEELQAMGPSTKAQIKALLTLTDEQLTEYVGLFQGKYAFARIKAEEELEGLKLNTIQTIQDLNVQAGIDLAALESEFQSSMAAINTNMAAEMAELKSTHDEALTEIRNDLQERLSELSANWQSSSAEINSDLVSSLNELKTNYDTAMTKINADLKSKLETLKKEYSATMKDVNDLTEDELLKLIEENREQLEKLKSETEEKLGDLEYIYEKSGERINTKFGETMKGLVSTANSGLNNVVATMRAKLDESTGDFTTAGFNSAAGFARGITSGQYLSVAAASNMAAMAAQAANIALLIKSPSKIFEAIGRFVSLGFANGIIDYADRAEKASEDMALGPIAAVSKALADLEGSDEFSFAITPVLDLSNLDVDRLSQFLGSSVNLGNVSSRLASETIQNGNRTPPSETIINNFNLSGLTVRSEADIDLIATKLYQRQQAAQRGRGFRVAPSRA